MVRLGFLNPDDAVLFIKRMEQNGLVYLKDGIAQEITAVDQTKGFNSPCEWVYLDKEET